MTISTSRTARFSLETSIESGSGPDDEEIYRVTFGAEVETGPVEAEPGDSVAALATVDGIAAGTATLTTGGAGVSVDTSGAVSSGSATAEVTAIAYSEGDAFAYAAADAAASLSGLSGAGFSLGWNSTSFWKDQEGSFTSATSEQTVIVVGTSPGGTSPGGEEDQEGYAEEDEEPAAPQPSADFAGWDPDWEWEPEGCDAGFDGNASYFWTDAEAYGEDSFVAVDISALAIEDQLSLLNISALAISA